MFVRWRWESKLLVGMDSYGRFEDDLFREHQDLEDREHSIMFERFGSVIGRFFRGEPLLSLSLPTNLSVLVPVLQVAPGRSTHEPALL